MTDLFEHLQAALADRYALQRELGRGGMATVYLAEDRRHHRRVALKVLHPELAYAVGSDRFVREIEVVAKLSHPHILPLFDSGEVAGLLYYVMPYVEGESLRMRLQRDTQLPVEEALKIAREVADALAYAHEHGVIHRDIKPENILLSGEHALVADFGIARALEQTGGGQLTETGMAVGTAAYMSPEQAGGDRQLDGRTDIYSLGCLLYEMLAGEPPYTGPSAQAIIAKRFVGSVPQVRTVRPTVPEDVGQAISRALALVPADRFATAADLARVLQSAGNKPMTAPTVPVTSHSRRPSRMVGSVLGLTVLVGLGVVFGWLRGGSGAGQLDAAKVLAVLPFENLGDSADAYFAEGVANDIRTKLSQLAGMEVIARSSSNEYRHTEKPANQIARELGVSYILSATVQWEKRPNVASRVRVTPELVEVRRGHAPRTRWGQQFDASLTDVFQVQADVATQVAAALDVALADSTRRRLAVRPTTNLDAYDAYLRGKEIGAGDIAPAVLRAAEAEFQRAVTLDSTFASAWAELAMNHVVLFRLGGIRAADADAARREVERATALAPNLPDVRAARGLYEQVVRGDAESALREYEAGLRAAPNRSDLLALAAGAQASRGATALTLARFEHAARLDPRSANLASAMSDLYLDLGRLDEAQAELTRARALQPSSMSLLYDQAFLDVARGDVSGAHRALREAVRVSDPASVVAYVALREDLLWLLDDAQQRLLLTLTPAALDGGRADWALALAETYWRRGDQYRTRAYADTARTEYTALIRTAENPRARAMLTGLQALALGFLGKRREATLRGNEAVGEWLAGDPGNRRDAYVQFLLIRIHLLGGDFETALDHLERLNYPPGHLKVHPDLAPLRGNPRFERIVNGS